MVVPSKDFREGLPRLEQPQTHVRLGDPRDLSDLRVRELLIFAENDQLPQGGVKPVDQVPEILRPFALNDRVVRGAGFDSRLFVEFVARFSIA